MYFTRYLSDMVRENTTEDTRVRVAESATTCKAVNYHQTFNLWDCNIKLNATLYLDSRIAVKQSAAYTKATDLRLTTDYGQSKDLRKFNITEF